MDDEDYDKDDYKRNSTRLDGVSTFVSSSLYISYHSLSERFLSPHAAVIVSTFRSVRFINICCIVSLWLYQKHTEEGQTQKHLKMSEKLSVNFLKVFAWIESSVCLVEAVPCLLFWAFSCFWTVVLIQSSILCFVFPDSLTYILPFLFAFGAAQPEEITVLGFFLCPWALFLFVIV